LSHVRRNTNINFLLCLGVCTAAQNDVSPVLACNLKAIRAAELPRYNDLMKHIRGAIRDHSELPDGYAFELDAKAIGLPEVAEWISMERLCCPFLTLQLSASGVHPQWQLKLTGPPGVKGLLEAEFQRQ
jgi:hypothetical protein